METFSAKWFLIYYLFLGFLLIGTGFWLIIKKQRGEAFLAAAANRQKPPRLFITILKYFLLFSLPGLAFSIIFFSWVELIFSLWSLLLVYIAGLQLVRWEQTKSLITSQKGHLAEIISGCGAVMVSVGFVLFLLAYLIIQKAAF
ncbi:MAG TPA: hypothetical protein VFG39_02855 [Balneolaceae bacterium]|nr:hypothetical protein [Balneolaceae bacterium]